MLVPDDNDGFEECGEKCGAINEEAKYVTPDGVCTEELIVNETNGYRPNRLRDYKMCRDRDKKWLEVFRDHAGHNHPLCPLDPCYRVTKLTVVSKSIDIYNDFFKRHGLAFTIKTDIFTNAMRGDEGKIECHDTLLEFAREMWSNLFKVATLPLHQVSIIIDIVRVLNGIQPRGRFKPYNKSYTLPPQTRTRLITDETLEQINSEIDKEIDKRYGSTKKSKN